MGSSTIAICADTKISGKREIKKAVKNWFQKCFTNGKLLQTYIGSSKVFSAVVSNADSNYIDAFIRFKMEVCPVISKYMKKSIINPKATSEELNNLTSDLIKFKGELAKFDYFDTLEVCEDLNESAINFTYKDKSVCDNIKGSIHFSTEDDIVTVLFDFELDIKVVDKKNFKYIVTSWSKQYAPNEPALLDDAFGSFKDIVVFSEKRDVESIADMIMTFKRDVIPLYKLYSK